LAEIWPNTRRVSGEWSHIWDHTWIPVKWLFDNSSEYGALINPLIMERLVEAHRQDSTQLTKAGFPCKQRKEMSKILREVLNNIRPEDPSSFPVKLDLITFHSITKYLRTFSKTVSTKRSRPIEIDEVILDGEMRDGGSVGNGEQDGEQQQTTRVQVRLSKWATTKVV
jgi:hypothetical protein